MYCSALVQDCYCATGIDFQPGVHGKNIAPHDIEASPVPHETLRMIRDPGISLGERIRSRLKRKSR